MSNAQRYTRQEDLNDDIEENEVNGQETVTEAPQKQEQEHDWKKRHGDLRRHAADVENKLKREIDDLKKQVESGVSDRMKLPTSAEEREAWKARFPDVYKMIKSLVMEDIQEVSSKTDEKLSRVTELEEKIKKEKDEMELLRRHADFDDLKTDPEFHRYLNEDAPKWVRSALYEDGASVDDADEALQYYKDKVGKKARKSDTSAARSVTGSNRASVSDDGPNKWTESKVEKLSDAEYEKYEDEIMAAMRTNQGFYDKTAGAR